MELPPTPPPVPPTPPKKRPRWQLVVAGVAGLFVLCCAGVFILSAVRGAGEGVGLLPTSTPSPQSTASLTAAPSATAAPTATTGPTNTPAPTQTPRPTR